MAGNYRATVTVAAWKQHTCVQCGCRFCYLLRRKVTGSGLTEKDAAEAVESNTPRVLDAAINLYPCPTCGLYQPDMVGVLRRRRHLFVFAVFLFFCFLPVFVWRGTESAYYVPWVAIGVALAALAGHLFVDVLNPNRNLAENVEIARRRVERGVLRVVQPGDALAAGDRPGGDAWRPTGMALVYGLFLLGVLALPAGELMRLGRGWRFNGAWQPQLVGPGDQAKVSFPAPFHSVKGYWSATGTATVLNADELGAPHELPLTSNLHAWGAVIDKVNLLTGDSSPTLWAEVQLPDDPHVAGQTLRIRIDPNVRYPESKQFWSYEDMEGSVSHVAELSVASAPGAMRAYWLWYAFGLGGGALATLGLSLLMARRAASVRARALPSEILTPGSNTDWP